MTVEQQGFVLTRRQFEKRGKTYIELWVKTEDGPCRLISPAQDLICFIRSEDTTKAESLIHSIGLHASINELNLKTFSHDPVSAIYCKTPTQYYALRDALSPTLELLESDIRLPDRYLMERFITAGMSFVGQPQRKASGSGYRFYEAARVKPSEFKLDLTYLSLDIECDEVGNLYSIGLSSGETCAVFMINSQSAPSDEDTKWLTWVTDEKALISRTCQFIREVDPDLIIGWNVLNFDFKVLSEASTRLGVPLILGRDGEPVSWRAMRNEPNQGNIFIPGRVVIDGIAALRTATWQFESFSLEFVAQTLLGEGKATDDVSNRLSAIKHDFNHNKHKLARYNLQDCQLVERIFAHTKLIDFLMLRSQLTGLELDRAGGSVAAFLHLYLPKLHRAGYVSPNRPNDGGLASPGGYVMNSKPGLYKDVLVLDFKSLYPSIIRTFKIDPLGLIEGLQNPDNAIPGFKGAVFDRKLHFLPDIIESLWKQRDEAKRAKDSARSQAIKILMNSFYGVLGSGGCPLYDTRLASSITMRGHEIMQTTAQWIEEAGFQVIYGDTDSTFVWLGDEAHSLSAEEIGKQLQESINEKWTAKLKAEFELDCALEIEFETHFRTFLMPTIRGSEQGSKKRYAGLKLNQDGTEDIVFKGLETVRSDWTPLAKSFQTTLYKKVFAGEDVSQFILDTIRETREGKNDTELVYKKRLRRKLEDYVKNVPPHVRAARILQDSIQEDDVATTSFNLSRIEYLITVNGPEPLELSQSPIDYDHYIEKQIRPIAEGILPFVSLSYDDISSQQLGLF